MLLVALWPSQASAIDVEQVVWGFDGQVVYQRFNPLSVLLNNPTPEAFEGVLRLQKMLSVGQPIDAPIEEPVFISPFSSRWVQFYPHLQRESDQWLLAWGPGPKNEFSLPQPRPGNPARILLEEPGALGQRGGGMKRLPDNLFPAFATGTDALHTVVLDHAPRWEESRREAFLDWLSRGGKVHILESTPGRYPEFPAALAKLNVPLDAQRVGAGMILRHPRTVKQIDAEFLDYEIGDKRRPTAAVSLEEQDIEAAKQRPKVGAPLPNPDVLQPISPIPADSTQPWQGDDFLLGQLKQMVQVAHNWGLINVLSVVYLLMIYPGCYLFGRRRVDYRLTFGILLGTIALFSVAFAVVGRRGYNEATTVHTLAIARPLAGGMYDVADWSHVFVTVGDDYRIAHPGTSQLYSACQEVERVNGVIRDGTAGQFLVDIPPFSSRTFAHRGKLPGPALELKLEAWQVGDQLQQLVLAPGAAFPAETLDLLVLHGNRFYYLERKSGKLELGSPRGPLTDVAAIGRFNPYERFTGAPWTGKDPEPPKTAADRFRPLLDPLITRSLDLRTQADVVNFVLPPDRARVFVYAPLPESFRIQDDRLGKQEGYVLYCVDLFAPESP